MELPACRQLSRRRRQLRAELTDSVVRSEALSRKFPREFGRYRLTALLGQGGTAEVYRAETAPVAGISRQVAIKRIMAGFVRGDTAILDETRIWVKLQHPNIVSVIDFGEEDGDWFVALELVEGVTASELVKAFGALPVEEALTIVERVARALHYAHTLEEEGVPLKLVHRDVKPGNILLSLRGEVKLTDFGIARAANRQSRTAVGILKGSLSTLSPEQVREEPLDHRSDLFALGSTLYHLIAGVPMFDLSLERLLLALEKNEIPEPPKNLPPKIRQLLGALAAADKERRPASAADVAKAIRLILSPVSPDDVEPVLAKKVKLAFEKTDRAADRASRGSGSASAPRTVPAQSPHDPTGDRPTTPPQSRGPAYDPTGDRPTTPSRPNIDVDDRATRPSHARAQETDVDLDRSPRPSGDDRTSNDLAQLLPQGDDLDARDKGKKAPPPPAPPAARPKVQEDDSTEVAARIRRPDVTPRPVPSPVQAAPPRREPSVPRPAPPKAVEIPLTPENSFELPVAGIESLESRPARDRTMTGRLIAVARRPSMKALGVFAVAVAVIAIIAVPQFFTRMNQAKCDTAPRQLMQGFLERGALATANDAGALEASCPPSPELRRIRQRALAFAGDTKTVRALLPPAEARDPDERFTAAALSFTEGDFKGAEAQAAAIAKTMPPGKQAAYACLAAAAAINQDAPDRAESHMAKVNGDCVRVLKAAIATQRGETSGALALLKTAPSGVEMMAAHESALGMLHLQINDQDAADADSKAAMSEARRDALSGHPFVWYSTHSPRGSAMVLRVTGPMDDPILYATLLAGDAARARGNLDLAFKFYDEAASRGGRTAIAEVRVALILNQQGKPQLARGRLTRALSIDPAFAPALVQLALIEEKLDPARAVEHAAEALKLQPENRDARRIAGR